MVLPLLKLGTLAIKTLSKPIASRLKTAAGFHPRFRQSIVNIAQVAGAAIIFEVQRNSRSEAQKEELRKKDIEELGQRDNELAKAVELLRHKLQELERRPKGLGRAGVFKPKQAHSEDGKSAKPS